VDGAERTGDFDPWIWLDPSNAARAVDALADFGFGSLGLTVGDFTRPSTVVQLGSRPTGSTS